MNAMGRALLAGVLLWSLSGCELRQELPAALGPTSSARVVVVLPRSLPTDAVARVVTTTTPERGQADEATLSGEGGVWSGLLRPASSAQVAEVRTDVLDAEGRTLATVRVPEVAWVERRASLLVLVPKVEGVTPGADAAPLIEAVVVSDGVARPGASVALRALATEAGGAGALTYAWKASGGSFSDATVANPTWTAPGEQGPSTLTLQVTDARGAAATLDFEVAVSTGLGVRAPASATFNRWPSLADLGVSPTGEVVVGSTVTVRADGADDDGDTLTREWAASCEGDLVAAPNEPATFTPSQAPSAACDNCRITVTLRDGFGGQREGSVDLCVVNRLPPTLVSTSQSATSAGPADVVRLSATAEDPKGEPLTFEWKTRDGALRVVSSSGGSTEVEWTELSCVAGAEPATMRVTVTNASGLSVSHTFTLEWTGRRCGNQGPCAYTLFDGRVALAADCTTEGTVYVPDGYVFDGAGHELVAVDPAETAGAHFLGAVLQNKGTTAHVRGVKVRGRGLKQIRCDAGANRLAGIRLEGASGSVTDSEVTELHENEGMGGCQEGFGIEVRNAEDAPEATQVEVLRNMLSGYQKTGIVVSGRVEMSVVENVLRGDGPVGHIAQNGIQVSYGATGQVTDNTVSDHSYVGPDFTSAGILVVGGPYYGGPLSTDVFIQWNFLSENDIGIELSQAEADGGPLSESTRIRVEDNAVVSSAVTNGYVYQAAISDLGGGNIISRNRIDGIGYDRATRPGETFDVDVVAGAASRIVFVSPRYTTSVGGCSEGVAVQSQDGVGNLSPLATPSLLLEVAGTAAEGMTLFGDRFCLQPLTPSGTGYTVQLEGAQQEAVVHFKATQAGPLTFTATGDGVNASQDQTVQ